MSDIPHFLSDLQAYADATFLGASTQFINFSIDDCETFMAIILKHIVKIINKAKKEKKEKPDSLPYITLMLALTRFDEILNILNKMEKLEKITGYKIPTSNNQDSLAERVIIGGAKCDEECNSNDDCKEESCPNCKDSTCKPHTDIVVTNNNNNNNVIAINNNRNEENLLFQSLIRDVSPGEVTNNQLAITQVVSNHELTTYSINKGIGAIQDSSRDAAQTQIYYLNTLEKQLDAAVRRRIEAQEAFTRYTSEAEKKMKADFETILKKQADRLKVHETLEHSAGLAGAVTGGWWAIKFSASAIDLVTRFKRGILNCGAWAGLGALKILREYFMFGFLDTINTTCVGMNPFDPMYPDTIYNGTTTQYRNEWMGFNGVKQVYYSKDLPGFTAYKVNSTLETVPNAITKCEDFELFDLENFTGVPLYIILGMLTAILTTVFMYYLVRVGSLQTKLFTKRKKTKSTIGKISDTVGDTVGTILTIFPPALIYYIATSSDDRAILEEIVREMRIPQNGDLQSLDEYIKAQGELLRNTAEYKVLDNALQSAMKDEEITRHIAEKATEEGLKNLTKISSEQTHLLADFTRGIFSVSAGISTASSNSSNSLLSIANGTNNAGPLKQIANSVNDKETVIEDDEDDDDDEDDEDEETKLLLEQQLALEKKLANLMKQKKKTQENIQKKRGNRGGKNKTKKNKNSKKTKKHLLKNNKHKSKRTKQ